MNLCSRSKQTFPSEQLHLSLTPSVRLRPRSVMVEGKRALVWNWADRREPKHSCHFLHTYNISALWQRIWTFVLPPQLVQLTLEWYFIQLNTSKLSLWCSCFEFSRALSVSHLHKTMKTQATVLGALLTWHHCSGAKVSSPFSQHHMEMSHWRWPEQSGLLYITQPHHVWFLRIYSGPDFWLCMWSTCFKTADTQRSQATPW